MKKEILKALNESVVINDVDSNNEILIDKKIFNQKLNDIFIKLTREDIIIPEEPIYAKYDLYRDLDMGGLYST